MFLNKYITLLKSGLLSLSLGARTE